MDSAQTYQIIKDWYDNIGRGDMETVFNTLSEEIVFELPQNQFNQIIPYLGTHIGRAAVAEAFRVRGETTVVDDYGVRDLRAQGDTAFVVVYTKAHHARTGQVFEIEDSHRLTVNDEGKIIHWKVYFDPNDEVAAFKADINEQLVAAVLAGDANRVGQLLANGANPNTRDAGGLTALMLAAGRADPASVRTLLDAGADVFTSDSRAGATALHKACQGGSVEVVQLLVEAGAFVDAVATTTGHTPLMDALWFKWPAIVSYLLDKGTGLNISTHYGFALKEHFAYELNVTVIGKERLYEADRLLKQRIAADEQLVQRQELLAAVTRDDLAAVQQLLQAGAEVDARAPILNGFNDAHTPLLVASRDGHTAIVAELLRAGADVNATEPTFGAVPLHKAVYNGHAEIAALLVAQPGIDINFQGATNGYSPLHDAIWHGFDACAQVMLDAGARLDQQGHDGKTPLDLALEVFGNDHAITAQIRARLEPVLA